MTHITFNKERINLKEDQTVLSALLDSDYDIPNSCQAGVCQSCLMQAIEGDVPKDAQKGLKDTLIAQGYFLACCCKPKEPLQIVKANEDAHRVMATVAGHEFLTKDVLRLSLSTEKNFNYRAGQFITIWKNKSLGRSYSLASVAELDDVLELHIRRIEDGQLSNWLHKDIKLGDTFQIQAATGDCFYTSGSEELPTLLAGTGTGLAPLIGIARDALQKGHRGDIHLIHGARKMDDLYLHETLLEMAKQHQQFHYHANVLELTEKTQKDNEFVTSNLPLDQQVIDLATDSTTNSKLTDLKVYLCGDAGVVNNLKKKLFLSGVSMTNIYSDPFISVANT